MVLSLNFHLFSNGYWLIWKFNQSSQLIDRLDQSIKYVMLNYYAQTSNN